MKRNFNRFDFNKEFEKTEKRMFRAFWIVFLINTLIGIGVLAGLGWLVYALLKYFGIVG